MATPWRHKWTLGTRVRVTDSTCIPVWADRTLLNAVGYVSELRATGYFPEVPPSYRITFPNGKKMEFFEDEIEKEAVCKSEIG